MIEHSRLPLSHDSGDLNRLQQRADRQRQRHRQQSHSLEAQRQHLRNTFGSPVRSITRLPARFLLHTVVALVLPIAVLLSQLQTTASLPAAQLPAPSSNSDIVAPIAPLSLDIPDAEGDAPLDDNG